MSQTPALDHYRRQQVGQEKLKATLTPAPAGVAESIRASALAPPRPSGPGWELYWYTHVGGIVVGWRQR